MLLASLIFLAITFSAASACQQTCGPHTVPYPFGFSDGCLIRLVCSTSQGVEIADGFQVRNITSDSLLVDVPPTCSRAIGPPLVSFFGSNYAITWKNVLFLRNCTAAASVCVIPTELLSEHFDFSSCGTAADNITCLSARNATSFMNATEIIASGCSFLVTAIGYESDIPSLAFRTLQLGWWLDGHCACSPEATCTNVTSPTGSRGFRCSCPDGFHGDGFADGRGCWKAPSHKCDPSKYMSGSCGQAPRLSLLIGGIFAGACVTAILALICFIVRRRSSNAKVRKGAKRLLSQASCTVPLYSYKEMERATNGFSDDQRLGTGAYGTVYSGKLNDDKLVAIKRITHRDNSGIEQVMNEIKLLSSVSHPNLVRLLGCCIDGGEQLLVYEFMSRGTLAQHLQRERGPGLPWTVRLTVAGETAKAIAFLHSSIHPPIYHRDIKSSNILLDQNFSCKVADFGLSRSGIGAMETSHISTAPQGTPGYLDPQYHQNFHLSDKSDVYSFGVVLVEMITALKVVDFNREQNEINLADLAIDKIGKGRVDEIIDPFLEPYRDAWTLSSIHKVAELAFRCLAFHRDMRPSMLEVAEELELVRLSGWAPPDDVFTSPASSLCSAASISSRGTGKTKRWVPVIEHPKVDSPVSVQDPWLSQESSPSSNSLLRNQIG